MLLRGVNYKWRADDYPEMNFEDGVQLGVIAQEIEAVFPEVVQTDNAGYKSVEYSHLVPALIEAIKDLNDLHQEDIDGLKQENQALKAQLDEISNSLNSIKALLTIDN